MQRDSYDILGVLVHDRQLIYFRINEIHLHIYISIITRFLNSEVRRIRACRRS